VVVGSAIVVVEEVVVEEVVVEEVVVEDAGDVEVVGSVELDVGDGTEAAAEHPASTSATTPAAASAANRDDGRFAFVEVRSTSEEWAKKAARAKTAWARPARRPRCLLK